MASDTLLKQKGVQRRMQCDARTAARIENVFVTVERLVEACEADEPPTEVDGIGPSTAETIESWWDEAEEREEQVDATAVEHTSSRSLSVYNLGDWSDALGMDDG